MQDRNRGYDRYGRQDQGPYSGVGPKGYRRPDDAIFREVCDLMIGNGQLNAGQIDVSVNQGEVTLDGTVDSRQSKRLAEEIAESVPGVKDVQNRLHVQPHSSTRA